jgi:hypothetical protein
MSTYNSKQIFVSELREQLAKWTDFKPAHFFNSPEFIESLAINGANPTILGFYDEGTLVAYICLGSSKDSKLSSPFLSTLGGFEIISRNPPLEKIDKIVECIINWRELSEWSSIEITLNPRVYKNGSNESSYLLNSMLRSAASIAYIDLTFLIDLESWDLSCVDSSFRRRVEKSKKSHLKFVQCSTLAEKSGCYNVIKENRTQKGYPLHLSFEYLISIGKINQVDFFIVENPDRIPVASAIIYHLNREVVLVVYWGDLIQYRDLNSMAFLISEVVSYYRERGLKIIDTGTSTKESVPNFGLTSFKDSIGTKAFPKITIKF